MHASPQPFVSVIVPTFNRRALLEKTLESLRTQDYPDYEVLVCDDCSSDGTYEFLLELQKSWPGLKVFRNEKNLNFNGTLQRLFGLAKGELIGMQHDHDIYKPTFISSMVKLLAQHPTAGFGCAAYDLIDTEERFIPDPDIAEFAVFKDGSLSGPELINILANSRYTPIAAMSTMFRKEALEHAGGYQTDWYLASDEDLYRRMAQVGDIAFCPDRIFAMRLRPNERQKILGSWKSIYTLFLFRMSVADMLSRSRLRAKSRQFRFKWTALVSEGLSLWLRGESEQLREAIPQAAALRLPGGRKPLNAFERALLRFYVEGLRLTIAAGPTLNRLRKRRSEK
jgi:glycosyltransferase involved in cell wall biosynthesis